ncbi:MAG: hypothetical protein CSH37_04450 [Thalassolituus sp.]|nr:MAG: hypothetical protein CSH37_04450 [Thalassolituus sp.]
MTSFLVQTWELVPFKEGRLWQIRYRFASFCELALIIFEHFSARPESQWCKYDADGMEHA